MTRRTLATAISASGTALHAGGTVTMTLSPAPASTGIVFRRADLGGKEIPALYDRVGETRLGTVIARDGASVGVIEHLMAAVAGAEIDDLLVTLDGPEPPILDGDALSYLALIQGAGVREQDGARPAIRVLKPIEVGQGEGRAALLPAETGFSLDFEIVFATPAIGTQTMDWTFSREAFARDIAPARTFGFLSDLDALNKAGLGRGASLANTLAIDGDKVVNAELMRFPDEFVRHKILDAIGDMATAGAPLIARFEGRKSGHALNNALLRALFEDAANYEMA
ncbi:MAG: UDP-3-O-acyl-N-acetylglucosamine deacetylase [Rhizomicrobium sp.]